MDTKYYDIIAPEFEEVTGRIQKKERILGVRYHKLWDTDINHNKQSASSLFERTEMNLQVT